ncbi:nuclear transcription factor Y subunit B-4-like isoform X2 [Wolffia australiana]
MISLALDCSGGGSLSLSLDQRMAAKGGDREGVSEGEDYIKEHERLLPIANVGRIMKKILPPSAKISKAAKETMQESVSEFIGIVTSEAATKCIKEKRKTVNGDDICWALGALGLDDLARATTRYLEKHRLSEAEMAEASRRTPPLDSDQQLHLFKAEPVRETHARTSTLFHFDLGEWERTGNTPNPY